MRLYGPDSSIQARQALVNFGMTTLLSNRIFEVFVDGRSGDRCTTLKGNGKLKTISCKSASFFICEYKEVTTTITCDELGPVNENFGVNVTGINSPVTCFHNGAISNENTFMTSKAEIEKESIVLLLAENNPFTLHLPIDIASNFPNLQLISFIFCSISEISYNSLKDLSRLTTLGLSYNNISKLDANVFKDLVNLKTLNMGKL
jgi:Leucine-rich repeat (LRR) protein